MKYEEPSYIRKGRSIKSMKADDTYGKVETFPSISAAKRHSRALQEANGGRGQGYVRVERKGDKR